MSSSTFTFALIKSEALAQGHYLDVMGAIRNGGLSVVSERHLSLSRADAARLYANSIGQDYHDRLMGSVTGAAGVVLLVLAGDNAVRCWRQLIGPSDPRLAGPDTIRGRFGTKLPDNVVHGSDSDRAARREVLLAQAILHDAWFGKGVVPCPEKYRPEVELQDLETPFTFTMDGDQWRMTMDEVINRVHNLVKHPVPNHQFEHMIPLIKQSARDPVHLAAFRRRILNGSARSLWLPLALPRDHGCGHGFDYNTIDSDLGPLRHVAHRAITRLMPDCLVEKDRMADAMRDRAAARFFMRVLDVNACRLDRTATPDDDPPAPRRRPTTTAGIVATV